MAVLRFVVGDHDFPMFFHLLSLHSLATSFQDHPRLLPTILSQCLSCCCHASYCSMALLPNFKVNSPCDFARNYAKLVQETPQHSEPHHNPVPWAVPHIRQAISPVPTSVVV